MVAEVSDHKKAQDLVYDNPELVEPRAKTLYREFRVKNCKLDLLLKGSDGSLLVVEVNTSRPNDAGGQVKKYRDAMVEIGEKLFNAKPKIRGYIVMPHAWTTLFERIISDANKSLETKLEQADIPSDARHNAVDGIRKFLYDRFFPAAVKESDFTIDVKYL